MALRGLSERFSLVDQRTRLLRSRLGFWRGEPFDMEEWSYERDLNLDLFAAQRGAGRQGSDLSKCAGELLCRFDQRRAFQRPPARFAPPFHRLLCETSLSKVMRQHFRLARSSGHVVA